MNYIDVYFARRNHMGESIQEIAKNSGERSFDTWLKESPHTVRNLSVDRGLYFSGIILTNKDDAGKKVMTLNVAVPVPIQVGDLMNWEGEKWLLYSKERKVNEYYQTFEIIRCNCEIEWVDEDGIVRSSWAYFTSSLEKQIKENFRTMYSALIDSTNKYGELIMPTQKIRRQTRFIFNEEAWRVSEFDKSSVQGIIYASLTEDTINTIEDNIEQNIADEPKIAKYEIVGSEKTQNFTVGEEVKPDFYIMKDGKVVNEEYEIIPQDKKIVKYVDNKLTAIKNGSTALIIQLKAHPEIKLDYKIAISNKIEFNGYIEGDSNIKLNRSASFKIISNDDSKNFIFSLDDENLAYISGIDKNECTIQANKKNRLGFINLTAVSEDIVLKKEIKIIPLW